MQDLTQLEPFRNITSTMCDTEIAASRASGWYALRCLTGKEAQAIVAIEKLGMTVCAPTYRTKTWPRKRRGSVVVHRALCPGYLFAQVPPNRWPDIGACKQIIGWVADMRGPLPVRKPERLRKFENAALAGSYDDMGVEGRLKPGDELEILFGPFSGWRVAFKALRGKSVEGEVAMLGAPRRVLIPAEDIHMRKG